MCTIITLVTHSSYGTKIGVTKPLNNKRSTTMHTHTQMTHAMKSNSESYLSSLIIKRFIVVECTSYRLYASLTLSPMPSHHRACSGVLFLKTCEQTLYIVCSIHSTCHLTPVLANCNRNEKEENGESIANKCILA